MPDGERESSDDYGPGTPCSQCGREIDGYSPEWTEYCRRHHDKREPPEGGSDLLGELEALAEEWEEQADMQTGQTTYARTKSVYYQRCADELQDVIDSYKTNE